MPINLKIPDTELTGFSKEAKTCIEEEVQRYGTSLVAQARLIDERQRDIYGVEGTPDVTQAYATQAISEVRPRFTTSSRARVKFIRASALICSSIAGVMYDPNPSSALSLVFLVTFAIALALDILVMLQD